MRCRGRRRRDKKEGVRDSLELSSHRNDGAKFRVNQSEEWNLFVRQALKFVLSDIPWKFLFLVYLNVTSTLARGRWLTSRSCHFSSRERYQIISGWSFVGNRTHVESVVWGSKIQTINNKIRHFTQAQASSIHIPLSKPVSILCIIVLCPTAFKAALPKVSSAKFCMQDLSSLSYMWNPFFIMTYEYIQIDL